MGTTTPDRLDTTMTERSPPEAPAGWTVSWSDEYRMWFYINSNTKESQWDRPVSPIASQPPSQREHVPHQETDRAGLDRSHLAARLASTQLEDEEEPPPSKDRVPNVPAGWIAKWSDQYQTWFYFNISTQESTWELPAIKTEVQPLLEQPYPRQAPPSMSLGHSQLSPTEPVSKLQQSRNETPDVPSGWTARWNDVYQAWFYINTVTQQSSWECPTAPAEESVTSSPVPPVLARIEPPSTLMSRASELERVPRNTQGPLDVPEVPSGWKPQWNDQYQIWSYTNIHTGKTSWERPTSPAIAPANTIQPPRPAPAPRISESPAPSTPLTEAPQPDPSNPGGGDSDLPAGWTKRYNEEYQTWFYVDVQTGKPQWEKPTAPAVPAATPASGETARYHATDEELARRLQAEEDSLLAGSGPPPDLPPRPTPDIALHPASMQRQPSHASGGVSPSPSPVHLDRPHGPDRPPSYEFATGRPSTERTGAPNTFDSILPPDSSVVDSGTGSHIVAAPNQKLRPSDSQRSRGGIRGLLGRLTH